MIVLYSEDVEDDLDAIAAYIAADSPRRAVSFILGMMRRASMLAMIRDLDSQVVFGQA